MTHVASPGRLLALTVLLGPPPARAVSVTIPAADLGMGSDLTAGTAAGVAEATELIVALCAGAPDPEPRTEDT